MTDERYDYEGIYRDLARRTSHAFSGNADTVADLRDIYLGVDMGAVATSSAWRECLTLLKDKEMRGTIDDDLESSYAPHLSINPRRSRMDAHSSGYSFSDR